MGESASARTERELAELRGAIDADLRALAARAKADADPRALARRRPLAVLGALGSLAALAAVRVAGRARQTGTRRTDAELDVLIARVGGRLDRLKGKTRKRLRESLRKEVAEVEEGPRAKRAAWAAVTAALTAALTVAARRFARRLVGDDDR